MTKEQIQERADNCVFDQICSRQSKEGCPNGICMKFRDTWSFKSHKGLVKARQMEMEI